MSAMHPQNKEVQALERILGLKRNKKYNLINDLRYGKSMIMTDVSHIKGLIINFFDHLYPSFLKLYGFLQTFITLIIKCMKNNNTLSFFTLAEYERWKRENNNGKGWLIDYYKGLACGTSGEAREYFRNRDQYIKKFKPINNEDHEAIEMAFAKKNADERESHNFTMNIIFHHHFHHQHLHQKKRANQKVKIPNLITILKVI